jgi:hypothetical protein
MVVTAPPKNGQFYVWLHGAARKAVTAFLVLLVFPMHNVLSDLWHAGQPWTDVAAGMIALTALGILLQGGAGSPASRFRWPVLALGLVSVTSALFNRVPWMQAVAGLRGMLPWMVLGLSASAVFRPRDLPGVVRVACFSGVALAAYGVSSYLTFRGVGGPFTMPAEGRNAWESVMLYPYQCGAYPVPSGWRLISTFMNDNYFGVWLCGLIPLVYLQAQEETGIWKRRAWLAGAVLMVVACAWTYSRAAALALLVGIAVLMWRGERRAWLLLLPVALAAPLFALPSDVYRFSHLRSTQGGRVESVQRTTAVLQGSPWLGHGPGTRGLADMNYAKIGYETGGLGLLAFGAVLLTVFFAGYRDAKTDDARVRRLRSGMLAGLAAVSVAAVGGEVWEMPQIAYYFWMWGGLLSVLAVTRTAALRASTDQG